MRSVLAALSPFSTWYLIWAGPAGLEHGGRFPSAPRLARDFFSNNGWAPSFSEPPDESEVHKPSSSSFDSSLTAAFHAADFKQDEVEFSLLLIVL